MARTREKRQTLATLIWSNIMRHQYLLGVSDKQLCELLSITSRTLYNYKRDPSVITVKQLQILIESFGIDAETLMKS